MNRRQFMKQAAFGAAVLGAGHWMARAAETGGKRPNIFFFFADDWGRYASVYKHFGPNKTFETPVFDQFAREGVRFNNAHVTSPSCTPCRSSLLSGQYFYRTGQGLAGIDCHQSDGHGLLAVQEADPFADVLFPMEYMIISLHNPKTQYPLVGTAHPPFLCPDDAACPCSGSRPSPRSRNCCNTELPWQRCSP